MGRGFPRWRGRGAGARRGRSLGGGTPPPALSLPPALGAPARYSAPAGLLGHGSTARPDPQRGRSVCGVTGGPGEARMDGGGWTRVPGRAWHVPTGLGRPPLFSFPGPRYSLSLGGSGKPLQPLPPWVPEATRVLRPTRKSPMPRPLQERSCPKPAIQLLELSPSHLHAQVLASCRVPKMIPPCTHAPWALLSAVTPTPN